MSVDPGQRDLARLAVPQVGCLAAMDDRWEPYRLLDPDGVRVEPVAVFLADLLAAGRSVATARSYGMDLLRWFRFLWAADVAWDRAVQAHARDFSRWLQAPTTAASPGGTAVVGAGLKPATRAHCETVLRGFYQAHLEWATGPLLNPFPLARPGRRPRGEFGLDAPVRRSGRYRPRVPRRIPRGLPDEVFNQVFAALGSDRDRALVAFYVSSGVRASELLGLRQGDIDVGRQLITVVRKGTRAAQQVPASADAFVWLRLYQQQSAGVVPRGRTQPLWWTLRRPVRPLTYHGAHRMFARAVAAAGEAGWTLHALRHTAAYRMARDPDLPLTDVQWVLGHARLSSTQLYTTPQPQDVITSVLDHHARRAQAPAVPPPPAAGYSSASLDVLFGTDR